MWTNPADYRRYHRDRMAARYARWKAAGACVICGEPSAPFVKCRRHRLKAAQGSRRWHRRHKGTRFWRLPRRPVEGRPRVDHG